MEITATRIVGLHVVRTTARRDHRGSFSRLFCRDELARAFGERAVVQINHSRTSAIGAVRGLHFQRAPHAEMKLVRCIRGEVFDVAVDLRANSATFLQWHAEELTPENGCMMIVPEGCAHGFQVLAAESELLYLHTAAYAPDAEGGIRPDDPMVAVRWPLPIGDLSDRDRAHPLLTTDFTGLTP